MKHLVLHSALLFFPNMLIAQNTESEQIVPSKVERATVFLQGLQITRLAETP